MSGPALPPPSAEVAGTVVPQTSRDPRDLIEPWRTPSAIVRAPSASVSETALDADLPELGYEFLVVHWNFRLSDLLLLNIQLLDVTTGSYLFLATLVTWIFSIVSEVFESTLHGGVPDETTSCHMAAGRHVQLVLGF